MVGLGGFDATTVEPGVPGRVVLPEGEYLVTITSSENKKTKNGTGQYLQLDMEVMEGPHKGKPITDRLNLDNQNADAVHIAQRTLSAICHAVGVMQPQDSVQLHGLPLVAVVKVRAASGEYGPQNDIKGYKKREAAPIQQVETNPGGSAAPWTTNQ